MDKQKIILKEIGDKRVYYDRQKDIISSEKNSSVNNLDYTRTLNENIYDTCIEVTTACNQFCLNCFSNSSPEILGKELSFKEIEQIINERSETRVRVSITGGEPFLHSNIDKIIELPKRNTKLNFVINSNGNVPIIQKQVNLLRENNWLIALSIHGNEKNHNLYVGTNSYNTIINNLKCLSEKVDFHIYSVINRYTTIDDINHLFNLRETYRGCFLRFILPRNFGRYDCNYKDSVISYLKDRIDDLSGIKSNSSNTEFISVNKEIKLTN